MQLSFQVGGPANFDKYLLCLLGLFCEVLDAGSERLVQDALAGLMAGRTTLVIAHRLSTIQQADQFCVMREGRIIETGSHYELNEIQDGIYRKLTGLQL